MIIFVQLVITDYDVSLATLYLKQAVKEQKGRLSVGVWRKVVRR